MAIRVAPAAGLAGVFEVPRGSQLVARARLVLATRGQLRLRTRKLPRGISRLTARCRGSTGLTKVAGSASRAVAIRVR